MKKVFKLESRLESINIIEKEINDLVETYKINYDTYGSILLSAVELLNNAIIHGNKLDPNKYVIFEYEINDNEFSICVQDEGNGFDYKNLPDPTAPENIEKPHGRGLFLISHLTDELKFENNGTKVICKIKLNSSNSKTK